MATSTSKPGSSFYDVRVERNVLIPLADGVTLASDLYLPDAPGPFPTLVTFYPYRKDNIIGSFSAYTRRWFAERGYAHLLVDVRGSGGSAGRWVESMHPIPEGRDGAQAVEWAATQDWCDGSVGVWGISYGGMMAFYTAAERPPHLKAIAPVYGMSDLYKDAIGLGGAPCSACTSASASCSRRSSRPRRTANPRAAGSRSGTRGSSGSSGGPVLAALVRPPRLRRLLARARDPARADRGACFLIAGWRDLFPEAIPRPTGGSRRRSSCSSGPGCTSSPTSPRASRSTGSASCCASGTAGSAASSRRRRAAGPALRPGPRRLAARGRLAARPRRRAGARPDGDGLLGRAADRRRRHLPGDAGRRRPRRPVGRDGDRDGLPARPGAGRSAVADLHDGAARGGARARRLARGRPPGPAAGRRRPLHARRKLVDLAPGRSRRADRERVAARPGLGRGAHPALGDVVCPRRGNRLRPEHQLRGLPAGVAGSEKPELELEFGPSELRLPVVPEDPEAAGRSRPVRPGSRWPSASPGRSTPALSGAGSATRPVTAPRSRSAAARPCGCPRAARSRSGQRATASVAAATRTAPRSRPRRGSRRARPKAT